MYCDIVGVRQYFMLNYFKLLYLIKCCGIRRLNTLTQPVYRKVINCIISINSMSCIVFLDSVQCCMAVFVETENTQHKPTHTTHLHIYISSFA